MDQVATKNAKGITLHVGWDAMPAGTKLFSSDQLREAQVKVLREAIERMAVIEDLNPLLQLGFMADEIERSKT